MNKKSTVSKMLINCILVSIIIIFPIKLNAQVISPVMLYYSGIEENDHGLVFSPLASYNGHIHTNGQFNFRYGGRFHHRVTSGAEEFYFHEDLDENDLHFSIEPEFGIILPELNLEATAIRNNAQPWVSTNFHNRDWMTWIMGLGENGIDIYMYPAGTPRSDSLYQHLGIPDWQAIFIDGDCEIEGTFAGTLTIGCSGDMYLIDDVRYLGSDPRTGWFEHEGFPHSLGLVSEGDIIIEDNFHNGKANGAQVAPNDHNRHSIIINSAVMALGGSFRIEHTNADWERYQGPEPDERGSVYLKGSLYQRTGSSLFYTHHQGTGYGVSYNFDPRFERRLPPFVSNIQLADTARWEEGMVFAEGDTARVVGNSNYYLINFSAGSRLEFTGFYQLNLTERLVMEGTEDQPVTVGFPDWDGQRSKAVLRVDDFRSSRALLEHVIIEEGVELQINADRFDISHCEFHDEVSLSPGRTGTYSYNVNRSSVTIAENTRDLFFRNNTIIHPGGDGLILQEWRYAEIKNNLIAYGNRGIVNDYYRMPDLSFNNIYRNSAGNYVNCQPGRNSISENPHFLSFRNQDYHLTEGSPCIDAGDPNSPVDPDGSRADIGAFYFDQGLVVVEKDQLPRDNELTAYPNPFNGTVRVSFNMQVSENVNWTIFDMKGRLVSSGVFKGTEGENSKTFSLGSFQTAGIYFLRLETETVNYVKKLVYLE